MDEEESMGKKRYPSLYQTNGLWYFKITVRSKRITIPTGTSLKKEAEVYRNAYMEGRIINGELEDKKKNLGDIISLFSDISTNPRYRSAEMEGRSYSLGHAKNVARESRHLFDALMEAWPKILTSKISDISRADCFKIRDIVFLKYGKNHVSKEAFSKLKMVLTYAADIGIIPFSPAEKIPNIKPPQSAPIYALAPDDAVIIYSMPELFMSKEARAQFFVFATTGMRRAELGALTVGQISEYNKMEKIGKRIIQRKGHSIDIRLAIKDDDWSVVGLPKWDKKRMIPIADTTYNVLAPYLEGKGPNDRVFPTMSHHSLIEDFCYLREQIVKTGLISVLSTPEAIEDLTPHKLRHSLNTAFVGLTSLKTELTQEYMSWRKQEDNNAKMQRHYSHLNISHLIPVADAIEDLFSEAEENEVRFPIGQSL